MSDAEKTMPATPTDGLGDGGHDHETLRALRRADDVMLAKLGYKSEFKREFSVSPPASSLLRM